MTNKEVVEIFFGSLWTDPERARALATPDVTWITTRSMPVARPSAVNSTSVADSRTSPVATSNRRGSPSRNRPTTGAISRPSTDSCGPVMPASH